MQPEYCGACYSRIPEGWSACPKCALPLPDKFKERPTWCGGLFSPAGSTPDTYSEALLKWGRTPQITQLFEELGELIQAISKYERGPTDKTIGVSHLRSCVAEEMADVLIMMEQVARIYEIGEGEIRQYYCKKLRNVSNLLRSA